MRRNTFILIALILVLLIGGAGVAYFREREKPSPAFAEVDRFLVEAGFLKEFPAERAWTLANTKEETFNGGAGSKKLRRTKYAFQDRSGILIIVLLSRDGQRIVDFQVIGAPGDEEAIRRVLLDKFPPLEIVRQTDHS